MKNNAPCELSSNMEDYLEAIVMLKEEKGVARVQDVSRLLNVKAPSATGALNFLSEKGYVVHEPYGHIEFTPKGKKIATQVYERHTMLTRFLISVLGVDHETAEEDACKMEHTMSEQSFGKLKKFLKKNGKLVRG